MSTDTSKSPDKGSEGFDPEKVRRADTDFPDENGKWWQASCVEAEDFDALFEMYKALASVPRLEGTPYKFTDLTPSKEDRDLAWRMLHPNAMPANSPTLPGNPYPLLAEHLCCRRELEEARADISVLKETLALESQLSDKRAGKWLKEFERAEQAEAALATAEEAGVRIRDLRQKAVANWCAAAFGSDQASSLPQRGLRMLEEAVETAQTVGVDVSQAHALMDYVYARPVGDPAQELGGLGLTILALGAALNVSADDAEKAEVRRVLDKPLEHFAKRNKAKNDAGFLALLSGEGEK